MPPQGRAVAGRLGSSSLSNVTCRGMRRCCVPDHPRRPDSASRCRAPWTAESRSNGSSHPASAPSRRARGGMPILDRVAASGIPFRISESTPSQLPGLFTGTRSIALLSVQPLRCGHYATSAFHVVDSFAEDVPHRLHHGDRPTSGVSSGIPIR